MASVVDAWNVSKGISVEWYWHRETELFEQKPVPLSLMIPFSGALAKL